TVAIGAVPVALFAERGSRVKTIVAMATLWSLATGSCMWVRGYSQLLAARSVVGLGEAGYGSGGAALIPTHFPTPWLRALQARSRTMLWVCVGGAAQLVVVSALWSWLPSFLNRVHGVVPAQAGLKAALVVLCGAAGSVIWGALIDRVGTRHPRRKLVTMALL